MGNKKCESFCACFECICAARPPLGAPANWKMHDLKIATGLFEEVWSTGRTYEIVAGDRNCKVDDLLCLREWDRGTERYSGRRVHAVVVRMSGDVLASNLQVAGFRVLEKITWPDDCHAAAKDDISAFGWACIDGDECICKSDKEQS